MTPAEFQAAFPAFEDENVDTVQRHIDAAAPYFDVTRWDDLYADGVGNFVAHRIVMEDWQRCERRKKDNPLATAGAPRVQETVDQQISVRYSEMLVVTTSKDPFMRTVFGQEYRALAERVGIGMVAV